MSLSNDVAKAIDVFQALGKNVVRERQKILAEAAKPMAEAGKTSAPRSMKPHYRYARTNKRSGKGQGKKVATYMPGNLSRSMQVLKFRRKKSAVYVGAKTSRRGQGGGEFKGRRADGFYLSYVEEGTSQSSPKPFWVAAYQRTKQQVENNITAAFKKVVAQYDKKV